MDKRSFFAGLALGRTMKGWSGGSGSARPTPQVWVDQGDFTHFYMDYRQSLRHVSFGRFCNVTDLFGSAGEIHPTEVEAVDGHTLRVWADLTDQVRVRIYGNGKAGLSYADGAAVPAYSVELYPQGGAPYDVPYLADSMDFAPMAFGITERLLVDTSSNHAAAAADQAALGSIQVTGSESAVIQYS